MFVSLHHRLFARAVEIFPAVLHPHPPLGSQTPYIVRPCDVIELSKCIGVVLEHASGDELFDHILAHRYLEEKDTCKLFGQLISGV